MPLKKKYKNRWKCQNPKFWVQFHPAKHVRIRKTFFPQLLYTIRQLKKFGFIDKSHFLLFSTLPKLPINQLLTYSAKLLSKILYDEKPDSTKYLWIKQQGDCTSVIELEAHFLSNVKEERTGCFFFAHLYLFDPQGR